MTQAATDLLESVQIVHAYSLSAAARAAREDSPETLELDEDDILEIEVEGGFTLWTSASRYRERTSLRTPWQAHAPPRQGGPQQIAARASNTPMPGRSPGTVAKQAVR